MSNALSNLMPIVKSAADVVQAYTGTAAESVNHSNLQDALEILGAVAPLVDSFSRGVEVTEEDVREALIGMDDALAAFDAEIGKQGG